MARRRRFARLLTLVLLLELALLCCACAHAGRHRCVRDGRCSICEYARLGLRAHALPVAAALVLVAGPAAARRFAAARGACLTFTLFDRRVQLND